ncbi:MAG: M23 family metallopeptidase [Cyclobacteriaceae bacterium]
MQTNRKLLDITTELDSLSNQMLLNEQYIDNIKLIVSGDPQAFATLDSQIEKSVSYSELKIDPEIHPIDSQFRAEFENRDLKLLTYRGASLEEYRELYLFSPMGGGIITDGFNPKVDHFGVDIVAKEGEPVISVSDGVVIFSSWTLDNGYVIGIQHKGNLISVYKHNSELLKNVGSFVSGGDIIAIIGNTGELTSGPHLHFELWHNGNSVNPEEYIAF